VRAAEPRAVLSLLGLAIARGAPLGPSLTASARSDPALAPWAKRLAADLNSGQALGETLFRHGLIDRKDRRLLAGAEGSPATPQILAAIAGRRQAPAGIWVVEWFPSLAVAAFFFGLVIIHGVFGSLGAGMKQIYDDMGIDLPDLARLAFEGSLAWRLFCAGLATGIVVGLQALLRLHPAVGWIRLFSAPRLQRARLRLLLTEQAWTESTAQESANETVRTAHEWQWRQFWALSWFSFSEERRSAAHAAAMAREPLDQRLIAAGLLSVGDDGPRWHKAIDDAVDDLHRQSSGTIPLLLILLGLIVFFAFSNPILLPMLDLTNKLY
jgi:type II secretory pathway component PulF